ncbi:hypothetical protein EDD15DRAFT_2200542 [Pisolithus albus]|nr:hypothetical protein EDD15DRAFT_2200542 [Pisolithus albus]
MSSIEDLKRPTIPSSLNGVLHDAHYGDIVNNFHFKHERVGGVFDGRRNPARRWFELVIVEGVDENDSLLQEEIPGALLPIAAVDSLDEAIGSVDAGLDQVQYEPLTMRRATQAHPTHPTSPRTSMRRVIFTAVNVELWMSCWYKSRASLSYWACGYFSAPTPLLAHH